MRIDDWFLTAAERGNPATKLDSRHLAGLAWTTGNEVRPLVHGVRYFAELLSRVSDMRDGDLLMFTDWRGDPDERLTDDGPSVEEAFCAAARRGVHVRGLIWRSHWDKIQFSGEENRHLGEAIVAAGGQCLLDMRVRVGGSHHQKMVVLRHPGRPELDVAFVGGIDLCHSRRDDASHRGDPQRQPMAAVFGERPPWHDIQAMIRGPAVADVEASFRERWYDTVPITLNPASWIHDLADRQDDTANRLPDQLPDPAPCGTHAVQVLRTYPFRRPGFSFAPKGERSIARGYLKVLPRARSLIYLEDQYLWATEVVDVLAKALAERPELRMIAVIPRYPDMDGAVSMPPNLIGRIDALRVLRKAGGDRVGIYGLENEAGTPIYVHAKVCVVDDTWTIIGSDNFNRRSWTHDSEISCAVLDLGGQHEPPAGNKDTLELPVTGASPEFAGQGQDPASIQASAQTAGHGADIEAELSGWAGRGWTPGSAATSTLAADTAVRGDFARALRIELSNEHLGTVLDPGSTAAEAFDAFWRSAAELDAWHATGRRGARPPGQLRHYHAPSLTPWQRAYSRPLYKLVYDPDGRPRGMRRRGEF
ncbi:MAG TPA: phospholipase D family protein [Streptosporangiaceae bacterium]|nr:phospholipase D family protein [Streptosporangiaceae bacterium]